MRKIILIILTTMTLFSWETTTHRAIDRKAIQESNSNGNLKVFIKNSQINTSYVYINEQFEIKI